MVLKMDRKNFLIVGLVVLLLGTFVWISVDNYRKGQVEMRQVAFEQGARYGYESAVVSVMEVASGCEVVPLRSGNFSMNVVAVECLQQGGGQ
ncbi:MAG: hypothetical protein MI892_31610 [Desulfobacterales bacterium]|nr:hypothetical protein [Desulfobacterales bacterium]